MSVQISEHLPETGERITPEVCHDATYLDHLNRYRFATQFVDGKRILDIACGEGYGAAGLMRAGAASVVGVDVNPDVVAHACAKYGIDARLGTAEQIPAEDESFDVVVSFETLEHLSTPGVFLREIARVLVSGGRAVLSTPNRVVVSAPGCRQNEFHHAEMIPSEFRALVESEFKTVRYYSQGLVSSRPWSPRALAATHTQPKFRLLSGLAFRARWRLCSKHDRKVPAEFRVDPAGAIADFRPTWADRVLANSRIRPWNPDSRATPTFMLAVATR
jgi:SAM-dependent methyltransferase